MAQRAYGMSYPLPTDEAQRLAELRRLAVLDTPPEKAFDAITRLAASLFEMPIAAVTLIDQDRQWFKSCVGLETRDVGRNFAFCAHAILGTEVMVVPDARVDPRFAEHPLVTGPPHIRFYAGAPLRTRNGLNLGTLTVSDTKLRDLTPANLASLSHLAELVVDEIELRYEIGGRQRAGESLRLLEAAMQQGSDAIMITTALLDPPGPEIVLVNPAFTKLTGYTAEEVVGKTPRIFQGPKTDCRALDEAHAHLARGEAYCFEVVNYRKDGSDYVVSNEITPIRDESGKVTHFIGLQCDATERNRVAAALHEAKEEAERANRAKSEFLSRMSHELRTPLHAILGFAQLLEAEGNTAEEADNIAQIIRAGNHLLGLINEVLDIARVEAGKLALTPEPVAVRDTLEEALSLVKPLASQRGVRLEPLAGDVDCDVLSTALRFKQVMLNLLSNAVKYNVKNGLVSISCQKVEDRLRIEVADTGRGISAENMLRLFQPFERLEVSDTVAEGAGLGLSLSKHLIEMMGGKIGVKSTVGSGSTFWVELPLVPRLAQTATPLRPPVPDHVGPPDSRAPRTLLYIEDNLSNLRLVERILERRPEVTLISAMQGSIGLELAQQHQPDVILLDLHLPDLTGEEVLRRLRADPATSEIPVVMISADATAERIQRLREAGAEQYLTKPIDVHQFLAVVDSVPPRRA